MRTTSIAFLTALVSLSLLMNGCSGAPPPPAATTTPSTRPARTPVQDAGAPEAPPETPSIVAPTKAAPGTSFAVAVSLPDSQVTYAWGIAGGTFAHNATTATGTQVTVTAGNGTNLSVVCFASNAAGSSAPAEVGILIQNVPSAPAYVVATAGNASATLTWAAAASNGSAVLGYNVAITPDTATARVTSGATGATVTGLNNGVTYAFAVSALNANGEGPATSATATPGTVPGAPTLVTLTSGNGALTGAWSAPSQNGGAAITQYRLSCYQYVSAATDGTTLSATVTGLANGYTYACAVTATNVWGTGPASNALYGVPAGAPAAPTSVSAIADGNDLLVEWTPGSANGSAITSYTITPYENGTALTPFSSTNTAANFTNGTLGTAYTFTVKATNAVGTSVASSPSNAEVDGVPRAPGSPTLTSPAKGTVQLNWTAPSNSSGLTGYNITLSVYSGGRWVTSQTLTAGASATSLTATVTSGLYYEFTITATNSYGTSSGVTSSYVLAL